MKTYKQIVQSLSEGSLSQETHKKFMPICADILKAVNAHGKYNFKGTRPPTGMSMRDPAETFEAFDADDEKYEATIVCVEKREGFVLDVYLVDNDRESNVGHFEALDKSLEGCAKKLISQIKSKIRPKKK